MLLLILTACGGLASEPPILVTAPLPTITPTSPPDLGHPPVRVSLARGAEIFGGQQGCWNCHGMAGKGDGPVVQQNPQNFPCKITDFTQADRSRSITISAWFGLASNGNNDQTCFMPPWKGRLNEQQRWDVTSYIYSLHYTPAVLDQGKAIWAANCESCHGATGAGDGPDAKNSARPVPNFSDPLYLISHSDTDLWNTVTNGLGAAMPSFKTKLSDDERWAAVAYARSLTWEGVGASAANAAATPTLTPTVIIPDGPTVNVSGKVTNGTAGGTVATGLDLTLRVIDLSSGTPKDVNKYQTKTGLNGAFSFGDVPRQNNLVYVVASQYAGVLQTSSPMQLQSGSGPKIDLSFHVYELTTDLSVIHVEYERTFVRPNGQNSIQVLQGVSFHNNGDHIFLTDRKIATGDRVTVEFKLPADAQNVTLDQSIASQWEIDQTNGPAILGVIPISPATSAGLQLSYTLPFNEIRAITQTTLYPIDEQTVFLPDSSGLSIQESAYVAATPLQLQEGTYNTFAYQKPIRAGETYTFTIVSQGQQDAGRRNVLAVVLFVAALAVSGMIVAIWRLNRGGDAPPAPLSAASDKLVRQIADLDEQFEAGGLKRAEYEAKRAEMKAKLAKELEDG